jgi:hypothetical protein
MYTWFKSFFYAYNIGECDEQNILNLEMVLFHLKHNVQLNYWQ